MRNTFQLAVTLALFALGGGLANGGPVESNNDAAVPFHAQGEKSGDPTQDSIILLTRLTAVEQGEIEQDVPGMDGRARFEVAETPDFKTSRMTPWVESTNENDHTIKQTVTKLKSGRDYWYRVHITDASGKGERVGPARSFKTAPSVEQRRNVRFAVITGQGYATRDNDRGHVAYHGIDKLGIDFIALTGDTVYYDGPAGGIPKSLWPPGVESKGEVLSVKHGARGNYWPDQDVSGLVDVLHDLDLNRTGGFLCVDVDIADESRRPTIDFTFYDPDGNKLDGWLFSNKAKARERDSP